MQTRTMVAWLCELIETHAGKCGDEVPHIVSYDEKSSTSVESIGNVNSIISIILSDGSAFLITVERYEQRVYLLTA